ncbi:8054_t:CDS:2, partial [Funneliformis caledonium]
DKEPLIVYNRTTSKTESVVEIGAITAESLDQVVERANIIFTSLANDDAVNQVYDELLKSSRSNDGKNAIFIEMSTIYPTTIANIKERVEKIPNRHIICCPVWGPPISAKEAQLVIITSGHQAAIEHVMPLLIPVLGKKTISIGEDVTKGVTFKLTGNFFIAGIIELLSEGMTLAEKTGIGRDKLMEFVDLFFPFGSFQNYVTNSLKDVDHMRHLAAEYECPLPVIDIVHQHLISAKANNGENYDWSSIVGVLRIAAGLPFVKKE